MPRLTAAFTALMLITNTAAALFQDMEPCSRDEMYPDFVSDCEKYYKCSKGKIPEKHECQNSEIFSFLQQKCARRDIMTACVQLKCDPADSGTYAEPGTKCRLYYRCVNGTVSRYGCEPGTWFNADRASCIAGPGVCYEPLCYGLTNGNYPDTTHRCRREFSCRGSHVVGVNSCQHTCPHRCQKAKQTSIPVPIGNSEARGAGCEGQSPGLIGLDCARWVECGDCGNVLRRGRCILGTRWSEEESRCVPGHCDARDECRDSADLHVTKDPWDCAAFVYCKDRRVIAWGRCPDGKLFNGVNCVFASEITCTDPAAPSDECDSSSEGKEYADVKSGCRRYYRCQGGKRTVLNCPYGTRYEEEARQCIRGVMRCGESVCVTRRERGGCRGYYWDCAGEVAHYRCPPGTYFHNNNCVVPGTHQTLPYCPDDNGYCKKFTDGLHFDSLLKCTDYFYCDNGDRIYVKTCPNNLIFNGEKCVSQDSFNCPPPGHQNQERSKEFCSENGFFVVPNTQCIHYYFCIDGRRTSLTCPKDQVFNGDVCLHESRYKCPV